MLVLSRKIGESIVIDGGIVVKVVEVSGSRVRLGIQAPRDVHVHRQEVAEAMGSVSQASERELVAALV